MTLPRPFLLLWCLLLAFAACSSEQQGQGGFPALPVEAVKLEPRPFSRTVHAVGTLESPNVTDVAAEIAGRVDLLDVPEGQSVEKGHLLARLDQSEALAALTVAKARHENARDRLERLKQLRNQQVIAQQNLDDALAELRVTEGELEQARTHLDKTEIRAPFAGMVGLRQVSLGQYLKEGASIVRLTQVDPLHLVFNLPERNATEIREGQTVRGTAEACEISWEGQVIAVAPFIDTATRTVGVKAVVPNAERTLRPGMSASLDLEIGRAENALVLPTEALIRGTGPTHVFVIGNDGVVASKDVEVGLFTEDEVQIVAGLSAGDVVVTAGHQKIGPGARAQAIERSDIHNPLHDLGRPNISAPCIP